MKGKAGASSRDRSIQELEGADWGDPKDGETGLVGRVRALRRVPLSRLTSGDIRLAVSQKVGLPWVLDLAASIVAANPLAEGDNYPGDILVNLMRLPEAAWNGRDDLRKTCQEALARAMVMPGEDAAFFREVVGD